MAIPNSFITILVTASILTSFAMANDLKAPRSRVVDVEGFPDSVVWAVQLSDLHFSVFHPERAYDFGRYVGPALAFIKPALVLITGDLTDGKSKDLLVMKQEEKEWVEYQKMIDNVVQRSGLGKEIFYDLRGNHDCFDVLEVGAAHDYYQKYSINAKLRRDDRVQSVTLQNGKWKHLFVGIDTAMEAGLRGPTNLFGHPTEQLLADLDEELAQWDTKHSKSEVTKISFGHFPLSFSALAPTGRGLKDVFLKHSLSAYICGHLHTRFGKNLKRHHQLEHASNYYQFNLHQGAPSDIENHKCSSKTEKINEFWEWEMGDWRKSRAMRVLAIDSGHVSFVDVDFKLGSKKTIILPTFPLDSRFMQRVTSFHDHKCERQIPSYDSIRTIVFSKTEIVSVVVKIYDTRPGTLSLVLNSSMKRITGNGTKGDLYIGQWNWKAFVDPSPERYWLQIETVDVTGETSYSQLRPFSINGLTAHVSWTWKEFFVMGCQWASIYHPALWSLFPVLFLLVLVPQAIFLRWGKYYTYRNTTRISREMSVTKWFVLSAFQALMEFCRMTVVWSGFFLYLFYLLFFPWFYGHVFTESGEMAYMTYRGWFLRKQPKFQQLGIPDIMVVVLPHLSFVVLPTFLVIVAMAAERTSYRAYYLSLSGKKDDDISVDNNGQVISNSTRSSSAKSFRWIRKVLLLISLVILWKHWKHCRALVKAYEMNPFLHSPVYCFTIPILLLYGIYKTSAV